MSTTQSSSPAIVAITAFGGVRRLAGLLGKSPSSISRWASRSRRGIEGQIPSGEHRRILELARSRGINLTADDLIFGRGASGN